MNQILRWIGVLPAAVAGYLIAQVAIIAVTAFVPWGFVSREASSFFTAAGFVVLGARVAPALRVHTAAGLSILVILASGMLLGLSLVIPSEFSPIELAAAIVLNVLGGIMAVLFVYQNERPGAFQGISQILREA